MSYQQIKQQIIYRAHSDRRDVERIIDQVYGLMEQQQKNMEEMHGLLRELLAAFRRN
jgi:DNA-binding ferritin-like protein (Dps family)